VSFSPSPEPTGLFVLHDYGGHASSPTMRSLIKAVKFEENAKVPPEKFTVPAGYKMK
jgi:hypothetical protein